MAALWHNLGKPSTTIETDGRIPAGGHEEAGVETRKVLDRLNVNEGLYLGEELLGDAGPAARLKPDRRLRRLEDRLLDLPDSGTGPA